MAGSLYVGFCGQVSNLYRVSAPTLTVVASMKPKLVAAQYYSSYYFKLSSLIVIHFSSNSVDRIVVDLHELPPNLPVGSVVQIYKETSSNNVHTCQICGNISHYRGS